MAWTTEVTQALI